MTCALHQPDAVKRRFFCFVLFCFFVLFVCLLQQVSLASQGEKSVSISWEFELTDFEISDEMRW